MDFPILILSVSPFVIQGCQVNFFNFVLFVIENPEANSEDLDQTPLNAASDQGLLCLPTSHKSDARLIWVRRHISRGFHEENGK